MLFINPYGVLNLSPYRIYGELDKVLNAPKILFHADIFNVSQTELSDVFREIDDLIEAAEFIGSPQKHPWRETTKTFYAENNLDEIKWIGTQILEKLKALFIEAEKLESILGLPKLIKLSEIKEQFKQLASASLRQLPHQKRFAEIETASIVASTIALSPGAPFDVLSSETWNTTAPPEALEIVEKGKRLVKLRKQASFAQVLSNETYQTLSSESQESNRTREKN